MRKCLVLSFLCPQQACDLVFLGNLIRYIECTVVWWGLSKMSLFLVLKGPFKYYVRMILTFLTPPTHLISRCQHFLITTSNMTSAFPHTHPPMYIFDIFLPFTTKEYTLYTSSYSSLFICFLWLFFYYSAL
jgi:hypothetical protein